jgi:hypothetical protein
MREFPGKGKVAVLKTTPETVLDDYGRVMELAGFREALPKGPATALKINISWQTWYPACSSAPWQIEGVGRALQNAGYTDLVGVHNDTVVVDARDGEFNNKHRFVTDMLGIPCIYLYEAKFEWFEYKPKRPFLVLDKVYPQGVFIPKALVGKNIVHLPTVKCVHPDTEVVLADGALTRIADLVEGTLQKGGVALLDDDGDARLPAQATLLSLFDGGTLGPQATRYFWRTPLNGRKIWRIRTRTGREVKVSSEHPFLTPHGWRRAATLQVKDRIAIPRKIPIAGASQPLPRLERAYGQTSTNWISIPEKTSPDFWRWVGYFMAEGWMQPMKTTCRFWWSNADPALQNDFARLTQQLFGLTVTQRPDQPNDHYFDSLQMQEFFESLGLEPPLNAGTKHIPALLFRCPEEELAACLEGYFDGDAGMADEGLYVLTKSERLARDVQYLLNRLGIIGFRGQHWNRAGKDLPKRPYHQIAVYGDELVALAHKIRLRSAHKQARLEQLAARRLKGKRPGNWDTIPVSPTVFRAVRTGLGFTHASTGRASSVNNIENGHTQPTRPILQYFVERFREADTLGAFTAQIADMAFLTREDIAWDHVISVEEIEPDTDYLYDFTMESAPNFIGNGVFLHNTHVFTTITGAMKNAFGGLLHRNRHWTHSVIHDTLVDLLMIQQDIHPGVFAVMDGTFAGDGPGPRAMRWHEKDILLASADQVAIDAISAKLQGFDPMSIRFIRRAHELGLGVGDPKQIQIAGYDINQEPAWNFAQTDTFASKGQKLIYHGPLKPIEKLLLQTPLVPWSYFASNFYHNVYWYPFVGRPRVEAALQTKWGQLFKNYGDGKVVMPGMEPKTVAVAAGGLAALAAAATVGAWLLFRSRG